MNFFGIKYEGKRYYVSTLNPIIECGCGCGNFLCEYNGKHKQKTHIKSHQLRGHKPPPYPKGKAVSLERRIRTSNTMKGKRPSEKAFWAAWNKRRGSKHNEETKRKIRSKLKEMKDNGYVFGWVKGKPLSKEHRKILFDARLNFVYPKKDTKPEKMVQLALELKGIKFEKHKAINGICQPDIFIEPNFCIFVDGDYWHANPEKWSADAIVIGDVKASDIWKKDLRQMYELNKNGYVVIRVWESDIKTDSGKIAENIVNMITMYKKGELKI